jgi:hypothetical protein
MSCDPIFKEPTNYQKSDPHLLLFQGGFNNNLELNIVLRVQISDESNSKRGEKTSIFTWWGLINLLTERADTHWLRDESRACL